jgi:hypothetical protein
VLGTIRAVEEDLMRGGLLLRYRPESGVDGIDDDEHPFLACSFWLVSAYAHADRLDDARKLMERLLEVCNDVGLLSEEWDPVHRRQLGNTPQALSHFALVVSALQLQHERPHRSQAVDVGRDAQLGRGRDHPRGPDRRPARRGLPGGGAARPAVPDLARQAVRGQEAHEQVWPRADKCPVGTTIDPSHGSLSRD